MTDRDPAVAAVTNVLQARLSWKQAEACAADAVDAYRRHVLAQRPDQERWANVQGWLRDPLSTRTWNHATIAFDALLAALLDEAAARRMVEAQRDRLVEQEERIDALVTTAMEAAVGWSGEPEGRPTVDAMEVHNIIYPAPPPLDGAEANGEVGP